LIALLDKLIDLVLANVMIVLVMLAQIGIEI